MLALRKIRSLDLKETAQEGRKPHLSAASGLVRAGSRLYVIADDELSIAVFDAGHEKPGSLIRLLPGEFRSTRSNERQRKRISKSLLALPAFAGFEHGALFALGSGSKRKSAIPGRCCGLVPKAKRSAARRRSI